MTEALDTKTVKFLHRHGYLPSLGVDPIDLSVVELTGDLTDILQGQEDNIREGIKFMQDFYGLEVTGDLDSSTAATVQIPRCTNSDLISGGANQNSDFSLVSRWRKNHLTWRIYKYPVSRDLGEERVKASLTRAFSIWSRHANLTFAEDLDNHPDIKISWETGDHQDGDPFDKAGGTLAHAFFPEQGDISGDIHFDDDENWTLGSYIGINLTQVAVHELGHSLGLQHTRVRGAIMFPSYEGYRPQLDLAQDDIAGIQALYGPPQEGGTGRDLDPLEPEEEWIPGDVQNVLVQLCTQCTIL